MSFMHACMPCVLHTVQNFGVEGGLPWTRYRRGLDAKKQMIECLSRRIHDALADKAALSHNTSVVARLRVSLTEEGLDPDAQCTRCSTPVSCTHTCHACMTVMHAYMRMQHSCGCTMPRRCPWPTPRRHASCLHHSLAERADLGAPWRMHAQTFTRYALAGYSVPAQQLLQEDHACMWLPGANTDAKRGSRMHAPRAGHACATSGTCMRHARDMHAPRGTAALLCAHRARPELEAHARARV
jgi:hypothetical protein